MTRSLGCPTPKGGSAPGTLSFPVFRRDTYGSMASAAIGNPLAGPGGRVFGSQRSHVPRAPAPLAPWQRDVPCVDAPTFKDAPRSVRRELDNRPISMEFNQPPAIDGP